MSHKEVYIIGAGTYGEAMCELAKFWDMTLKDSMMKNKKIINTKVMKKKVINKFSRISVESIKNKQFIVAIGNNKVRNEIMTRINKLGGSTPTLIHPTAVISPSATIGKGVYIQANAYIWTKVRINDFCIISPGAVIAHHSSIGDACLISSQATVGASITIEKEVFIGMGSTTVTGIYKIGQKSTIGAGALVLKDVDSNAVYAGVPAKKIRSKEEF